MGRRECILSLRYDTKVKLYAKKKPTGISDNGNFLNEEVLLKETLADVVSLSDERTSMLYGDPFVSAKIVYIQEEVENVNRIEINDKTYNVSRRKKLRNKSMYIVRLI